MDLMKTITDLLTPVVIPDWGALIGLIPVLLAVLVVLWLIWTFRMWAGAGPTRRAPARIEPIAPPTLHMPGPSAAPILVAAGSAALFLGLVLGGAALIAGVVFLVVTLLLWGREAVREYWHIEPPETQTLPAVVHEPPPGVHLPGPSIRPFMAALGSTALLGGLVVGGWVLILALIFLAWTLVGWLVDFTAEYRKVEEADRTGHLENIPPRRLPTRAIQVFAVLFVLVGMAQVGILPPRIGAASGGPGASPAAEAAPEAGPIQVVAKGAAFDRNAIVVFANKPFVIAFKNQDPSTPHDIDIHQSDKATVVQDQPITQGGQESKYDYKALPPGTYVFICSIHPTVMSGTLTAK
jgi:plastocyanin